MHKDLLRLFRKGTKKQYYINGEKGFWEKLDIEKIYENCTAIKAGIEMIKRDLI